MRKNLLMMQQKGKNKNPEKIIQKGVFSHLTALMQAQKYRKFIAFAVPNGGLSEAQAGQAKLMGAMSGVSDIIVILPPASKYQFDCCSCRMEGRTVFIELKVKTMALRKIGPLKGQMVPVCTEQSDDQITFMERARALGFPYHLVEATDISDGLNKILEIIKTEGGFEW